MSKNKKKKKFDSVKSSGKARRELEIATFGKLVSFRASYVHKSKRDYNRKENKKIRFDYD